MAVNNRTEADNAVDAALVATLTLAQHKALLKDEINSSSVFRKDVIASETPGGGAVTIDYSDKDTATVVTAGNLVVSFTNIENGDVKYLAITKQAGNTISFSGATDVTNFQRNIDVNKTAALYSIFNKNGNIYALALSETIIEGILVDINSAEEFKFTTAKAVNEYVASVIDSTLSSLAVNTVVFTGTSSRLLKRFDEISFQVLLTSKGAAGTTHILGTLPIGFRPITLVENWITGVYVLSGVGATLSIKIDSSGVMTIYGTSMPVGAQIFIFLTVRLY